MQIRVFFARIVRNSRVFCAFFLRVYYVEDEQAICFHSLSIKESQLRPEDEKPSDTETGD